MGPGGPSGGRPSRRQPCAPALTPSATARSPRRSCFFSSRRRHTRCLSDWSSGVLFRSERGLPRVACLVLVERGVGSLDAGILHTRPDRKSVVYGKSVDLGGRRVTEK